MGPGAQLKIIQGSFVYRDKIYKGGLEEVQWMVLEFGSHCSQAFTIPKLDRKEGEQFLESGSAQDGQRLRNGGTQWRYSQL